MLKGYRTYICLGIAALALLVSICVHLARPGQKMTTVTVGKSSITVPDPAAPAVPGPSTSWNLWLEIIASIGVLLATVFRTQVVPNLVASLKDPSTLLDLLKGLVNKVGSQSELDQVNNVLKTVSNKISTPPTTS